MVGRISFTKGGTHRVAFLVVLACSIVLGLAACSDEPDPTADAASRPTAAIAPPVSPVASATADSVVEVEAPQPTSIPPPEPPLPTPATMLTWEGDGLNDLEQSAAQSLEAIEAADEKTAEAVLELPWLADELTLVERLTLPRIEEIASEDGTLAQSVVELPWVADEITDEELLTVTRIRDITREDTALAQQVVAAPWVADGVTEEEQLTLTLIQDAAEEDAAMAQRLVETPEIPEVSNGDDPYPFDFLRSIYIDNFQQEFPELARTLFAYPGFDDGIFKNLIQTVSSLLRIARADEPLARLALALPWVADGITSEERRTLRFISDISSLDPSLARQMLELPWITDSISDEETRALTIVWMVAHNELGQARLLVSQSWFHDGITGEDVALLVTLESASNWTAFSRELIGSGHVRSERFSFPSGEVKVYVVSRSSLDQTGPHVFRGVREGIEAIEDFMGAPWVRPEVIVYLEPELQYIREVAGMNVGSHIVIRGVSEGEWQNYVIYHELAHFYFGYRNSPKWLAEGGANFLEAYTLHFGSGVAMGDLYQYARRGVAWSCLPKGITKVNDWNEATAGLSGSEYHLSPLWSCTYPIGEAFLMGMYNSLGHATVEAALRALHRRGERSFHPASEDDVYAIFLRNAPTEDRNVFEDTYFCLHGREIPYFARRPACEVYTPIPTPVYWAELEIFTPITPVPIPTPVATPTQSPTPMPASSATPDPLDGIAADRAALTAFYHATGGPNWINNDNWLTNAPLGQWYGVTTDDSGRVTLLDLHENGLTGQLPPELGDLANLVHLVVWTNKLTGGLPQELTKLGNLINLSVGNNLLAGEIPPWLSSMTNLEWLHLTSNRFTGTIPGELTSLTNLNLLYIYGYQLSGCIPAGLRRVEDNDFMYLEQYRRMTFCDAPPLPTLTPTPTPVPPAGDPAKDRAALVALYHATSGPNWENNDNWLTDAPLSEWYGVTTASNGVVTGLDLEWNGLSGPIPAELGTLQNLEQLRLGYNSFAGTIPPVLGNLTRLTWLGLTHSEREGGLTGEIPPELGNLTNLDKLYLGGHDLSGQLPPELGNLTKLEQLVLWDNRLTGPIPPWLSNLTDLYRLELWDNQLTGQVPTELGSLKKLSTVSLNGNELTGCLPESWRGLDYFNLVSPELPFCDN